MHLFEGSLRWTAAESLWAECDSERWPQTRKAGPEPSSYPDYQPRPGAAYSVPHAGRRKPDLGFRFDSVTASQRDRQSLLLRKRSARNNHQPQPDVVVPVRRFVVVAIRRPTVRSIVVPRTAAQHTRRPGRRPGHPRARTPGLASESMPARLGADKAFVAGELADELEPCEHARPDVRDPASCPNLPPQLFHPPLEA